MEEFAKENNIENAPKIEIERKYLLMSHKDATSLESKIKQLFPTASIDHFSEDSYYFHNTTQKNALELIEFLSLKQ